MEDLSTGKVSSSSSVEGEIAPLVFKASFSKSVSPQASKINEEDKMSCSSVEGEIYHVGEETIAKQQLLPVSQDGSDSFTKGTTSATSILHQTNEDETPKMKTQRRG